MRLPAVIAVILLVGGCTADTRRAIGQYQAIADKGVVVGPASQSEDAPAAKDAGKAAHANLPGTLGGDAEHRAYGPR